MKTLPAGWSLARMGDLIELNPKVDAPDSSLAGFTPMQGLGTRYSESLKFEARPWGAIKKAYTHFADGDVLLAKITPCFENGKAGLAAGLPGGIGAGSSEFFVCRPDQRVLDRGYLLAWLSCDDFRSRAAVNMSGSVGHKRVPKDFLLDEELPLAPIAEQARLVAKLHAMFPRVDACRDRLARVAPLLKRFRQSVLDLAFSGRLTAEWRVTSQVQPTPPAAGEAHIAGEVDVPDGWRVVRAEDVVQADTNIVYGIVQPGPKLSEGVPYVQTMDIVDGCIQVQGLSMTSPEIAGNYQRSSLRGGDVLLGIIRATKVAVVPNELAGANISRSVARFRPRDGVLSRYLALALEAPVVQRWLRSQHRGIDMPVLNLAQVRQAPIRVAPFEEQAEIVRRVDVLFAFADRLEARLEKAQAAADRLTPALLAKAFRGELVPQDPADEPAAELLKCLAASRPAHTTRTRPARREVVAASGAME